MRAKLNLAIWDNMMAPDSTLLSEKSQMEKDSLICGISLLFGVKNTKHMSEKKKKRTHRYRQQMNVWQGGEWWWSKIGGGD